MYKVFTLVALAAAVTAVHGQECKLDYQVEYRACEHPSHPKVVKTFTTEPLLVIKGGRDTFDAQCNDHSPLLKKHPTAKNIRFAGREDREAPEYRSGLRRQARLDVYCSYTVDVEVAESRISPACGISSVSRPCFAGTDAAQVKEKCVDLAPDSDENKWIKAVCYIDVIKNATKVKDIAPLYDGILGELKMIKNELTVTTAPSPNDKNLLRVIQNETRGVIP